MPDDSPWARLLGADVQAWLLGSDEAAARWLTLTGVLHRPPDDAEVRRARGAVLADPATRALLDRLPDWEAGDHLSGHDSPAFAPNLLNLLADMGVRGGDFPEVEHLLDRMLAHQETTGRFASFAPQRRGEAPVWGALLCDAHAVTEVLVRFGRLGDPRVVAALQRMAGDLTDTTAGRAWPCLPHSVTGWRGPGRKGEFCPMVTVQALRTFGRVPPELRLPGAQPPDLLAAARVVLRAWRQRGSQLPYMFGHGRRFKTVKWPPTWYSPLAVLDAVAGYPRLRAAAGPDDPDRRSLAELLACLLAYNVGPDGRVIPQSAFRGFTEFSFGQKKLPSAFATARVLATLARYEELLPEATGIDVGALTSSKGGAGTALPPAVRSR